MNLIYSLLILIFVPFIAVSMAKANSCKAIFTGEKELSRNARQEMKRLVDVNLYALRAKEAQSLRSDQIHLLNKESLTGLRSLESQEKDLKSLSYDEAQSFVNEISAHPVAGSFNTYDRPGVMIGYCFGRAAWVHTEALRKGFKKDQIRKLWILGPMDAGWSKWHFHVATAVRDGNGVWWVIDSFKGKPMLPEDWFAVFKKQSEDGKLRIYVTNPEKFTPLPGKYTRLQMGLDLSKTDDWYLHYFKDAYAADRKKYLQEKSQGSAKK